MRSLPRSLEQQSWDAQSVELCRDCGEPTDSCACEPERLIQCDNCDRMVPADEIRGIDGGGSGETTQCERCTGSEP